MKNHDWDDVIESVATGANRPSVGGAVDLHNVDEVICETL